MSNNTVFVTGAAAGIGRAICELFVKNGWIVGAADIDIEGLKLLRNQLGEKQCKIFKLDVTSTEEWVSALDEFHTETQSLKLLINNAGILVSGEFHATPLKTQQKVIDINVKGVMNGCHAAYPFLKNTPAARVINLASASAIYGQPSLAAYSASKFAVKGLTEALNLEWEKDDIHVMDVLPLFVKTAMVDNMDAESIKNLGIHLSAEDVANKIYQVATSKTSTTKVHWTVGTLTWFMYLGANLSPDWINRAINKWITRKK